MLELTFEVYATRNTGSALTYTIHRTISRQSDVVTEWLRIAHEVSTSLRGWTVQVIPV